MASSNSLPRWFKPTPRCDDYKQTLEKQQTRPHSSHYPDHCEQNQTSSSENNLVVALTSSTSCLDSQESRNEDHLQSSVVAAKRDIKSGRPVQVSRIEIKQSASIVKTIAMLVLAFMLAGILSVPVVVFTVKLKNSNSRNNVTLESDGGSMCQNIFLDRQTCFPVGLESSEVEATLAEAQNKANEYESQLSLLLSIVPVNEQCEEELLALVCTTAFIEFCDVSETTYNTLQKDCERITTVTCATEFPQIQSVLESFGETLSCDSLGRDSNIRESNISSSGSEASNYDDSGLSTNISRNCSEGFFVDDVGLCKPECGVWWPRTPSQFRLYTTTNTVFIIVGVILTLLVIILSCLYYKTLFQFPGVFIIYQMLSLLAMGGIAFVSIVDIKRLMCSSKDLSEVLLPGNASIYCSVLGAAWTYFTSQIALWWLFHLSMIFISVFWPFKYQFWKKLGYLKYIHATLVLVALILPLVPVIIDFAMEGYVLSVFYPPLCTGRNVYVIFYSYLFPVMSAIAIGIYLLILILGKFILEECKSKKKGDSGKRLVEIKILLLLLSYAVTWPVLIGATEFILIDSREYGPTLEEYFICEASGTRECSREVFDQFSLVPWFIIFLISLYPGTYLLYFFKMSQLKRITKLISKC